MAYHHRLASSCTRHSFFQKLISSSTSFMTEAFDLEGLGSEDLSLLIVFLTFSFFSRFFSPLSARAFFFSSSFLFNRSSLFCSRSAFSLFFLRSSSFSARSSYFLAIRACLLLSSFSLASQSKLNSEEFPSLDSPSPEEEPSSEDSEELASFCGVFSFGCTSFFSSSFLGLGFFS